MQLETGLFILKPVHMTDVKTASNNLPRAGRFPGRTQEESRDLDTLSNWLSVISVLMGRARSEI